MKERLMIVFDDVTFRYDGSDENNISNVGFNIKKGEFIVLTGKSGSGKSTITRCINGLIPKFFEGDFKGGVYINHIDINELEIHQVSEKVGSVFQDPRSQFFTTDTLSELAFTCENFGIDKSEIERRIIDSVNLMDIDDLLGKSIFKLSSGEKQKIAISSVDTLKPKIFLLDEPSSNLDYGSIERLRELLLNLKNNGYTIIISEHRLYYLKDLLNRVFYFEKGKLKEEFKREEFLSLSNLELEKRGLRSTEIFNDRSKQEIESKEKEVVLNLKEISFSYANGKELLKSININCKEGEIVALIGNNGTGKTTLGKVISGIYKENKGEIYLDGIRTSYKNRRRKVSFIMQDADYQLFTESVEKELLIGNEKISLVEGKVENALKQLDLCDLRDRHPASLSGGQKQRVTIALSMVQDARLIVMDEPTSGLDKINMDRVTELVNNLARLGKAVILITHDYEFIINVCNRVIYLDKARIVEDFKLMEGTENKLEDCFDNMSKI